MHTIHGGAFWSEVGPDLGKLSEVVRADVLDAWFPPAPAVVDALRAHAMELCRTSPEVESGPLRAAIALARGIHEDCIVTGGGSSALMFMALPILARSAKSALILDPMYGEYRGLLEGICGLETFALPLNRANSYSFEPNALLHVPGDLVAIVNPNSPTGQHIPKAHLAPVIEELARTRTVWIDETYIEYAGASESLEDVASSNPNVIVCKSMSKVYALSGLRVAYLVSHPTRIKQLSRFRPPWAVSLPAQVCASVALGEADYFERQYAETAQLRRQMRLDLESLGLEVTEGRINSLLVHLPGIDPDGLCVRATSEGVFLRNTASMWSRNSPPAVRISVRNALENSRILGCLEGILSGDRRSLAKERMRI